MKARVKTVTAWGVLAFGGIPGCMILASGTDAMGREVIPLYPKCKDAKATGLRVVRVETNIAPARRAKKARKK